MYSPYKGWLHLFNSDSIVIVLNSCILTFALSSLFLLPMEEPVARSSRRLTAKAVEVISDNDSDTDMAESDWGPEDGCPPPGNDESWKQEDNRWRKLAVNKYVYFRWSTAFNSKNRFKGIVTEHASRLGPRGTRMDYLTIKTFGISEDRYRMGKDIREILVLPNKTSLMETSVEDELRARAVRRWSVKAEPPGWEEMDSESSSNTPAVVSASVVSTQASTPIVAPMKPVEIKKPKPEKKTVVKLPAAALNLDKRKRGRPPKLVALIDKMEDGIVIHAKHGVRTIAGSKLAGVFSFYN